MRVERPCGEWETQNENSGDAVLQLREPAELSLSFRIQIVDKIASLQTLDAFSKRPDGNVQHRRQGCAVLLVQLLEHSGQEPALELDDVFRAIDESHFE